jgi:signal transduction histidine kinase
MMKITTTVFGAILLFCLLFSTQLLAFSPPDSLQIQQLIEKIKQAKPQSNLSENVQNCQRVIVLTEQSGNRIWQAKAYRAVGYFYEENSNWTQAETHYQKAIQIADELPYRLQLSVFIDWAIINKKLNRYKTARDYYNKVRIIANEKRDSAMLSYAFNGLGTLHEFLGDYNLAIDNYLKSVECAEKMGKNGDAVITLINVASVFIKGKNYGLAHKHIQKGYTLAQKLNDSTRLGLVYDIWGKTYATEYNLPEAILYYQKALTIFQSQHANEYSGRTLLRIAEAYLQQNDWAIAKKYLAECSAIKTHLNFYDKPILHLQWGKFYEKNKDFKQAITNYKTSFELAKERDLKDLIQESTTALSKVYQQTANWQSAIQYLNIANAYRDSIFNDNQAKRLAEAQYKFDVEKAESQLRYEQNLHQSQLLKMQQQQNMYWLLAVLTILVGVTLVLIYLVRVKHRYNHELLVKNQEIQLKNDRLIQSNEVLKQFAYASAHDLKEPLRSVSSFVAIIKKRYIAQLPPEANDYFEFVMAGVRRLDTLLAALLTYSTLASEKEELNEKTNLTQVLEDVKANLSKTINDKNALIEVKGNLPKLSISYLHLVQLLQNLISNALKFSEKTPHIVIQTAIENKAWIISIQDNGIGMKTEYSDKIFRLFQRLSRAAQYEGAGIGLSICQQIVEKYNGRIWFESEEGLGTIFFISFPIAYVEYEHSLIPLELVAA